MVVCYSCAFILITVDNLKLPTRTWFKQDTFWKHWYEKDIYFKWRLKLIMVSACSFMVKPGYKRFAVSCHCITVCTNNHHRDDSNTDDSNIQTMIPMAHLQPCDWMNGCSWPCIVSPSRLHFSRQLTMFISWQSCMLCPNPLAMYDTETKRELEHGVRRDRNHFDNRQAAVLAAGCLVLPARKCKPRSSRLVSSRS